MIEIIEVSPSNEMPAARKLRELIASAWPDVATSATDRVVIAVGARVCRECDLLVTIDLDKQRLLQPRLRRNGSWSPQETIQAAMIVIEVKQLDESRYTVVGTQIFPDYGDGKKRSVDTQVADCCTALVRHRSSYGVDQFFVHGLGWLTEVPEEKLAGVNPWIVGAEASWLDMLDGAAQQSSQLFGSRPTSYRTAIATIGKTLTQKRVLSPRDRSKAESLCREVLVDEVLDDLCAKVGTKQIRLTGRGGSGKTTTLALLAKRLASVQQARVLILTFHKALRGDIAHLVDSLIPNHEERKRIGVETSASFFIDVLVHLELPIPTKDGRIDFDSLPTLYESVVQSFRSDGTDSAASYLRELAPDRFDWDYVFIDEAQDWSDAERDLVRAMYGSTNIVIADGLEQLVTRQTPCDWTRGLPAAERHYRELGRSLRMTHNLALFANAFAREAGLVDWKITPYDALSGGRVIVAVGGHVDTAALAAALELQLGAANAKPVDALLCIPPSEMTGGEAKHSTRADELEAVGFKVWDATRPEVRNDVPSSSDVWRIVQYDSCRGLEGWATVAFALDSFVENKLKHPNLAPGERESSETVASRWLLIALTRAVHTLIVTIGNPRAPIIQTLRDASARLPNNIVEWTTGERLSATVANREGSVLCP